MKGCLAVVGGIVVVLLIVVFGVGGYFMKKGIDYANEMKAAFEQLDTTNKDFAFQKPASSKLDAPKLDLVLGIRSRVAHDASESLEQFRHLGQGDPGKIFDKIKDMMQKLKAIPGHLEGELRTARMSFNEFAWVIDTAYGTIFKAAEKDDPTAKDLAQKIEGLMNDQNSPSRRPRDEFMRFKNRTMASVDLDEETLALLLARKDEFVGQQATVFLDSFVSQRGEANEKANH